MIGTQHFHVVTNNKTGFTKKRAVVNHSGDGEAPDPAEDRNLEIALKIGQTLERHYPSHAWHVEVDQKQGVAMIRIPVLMKPTQKYIVYTDRLVSDPGMRSIVRAGGEILERYNIPRSGFNLDIFLEARMKALKPRLFVPDHYLPRPTDPSLRPKIIINA